MLLSGERLCPTAYSPLFANEEKDYWWGGGLEEEIGPRFNLIVKF